MTAFQPKGDQARWRVIYAMLREIEVNAVLHYDSIATALMLNAESDRHSIQMAMRRAARELEEKDNRAIDTVPNVGYRVVPAPEHLVLARKHQRKAGKSLIRGHSKVVHVDLAALDPEVRSAFQVVAQAFSLQMDMNRRLNTRQNRMEEIIGEIVGKTEKSEAEVAELRDRLERLEKKTSQQPVE